MAIDSPSCREPTLAQTVLLPEVPDTIHGPRRRGRRPARVSGMWPTAAHPFSRRAAGASQWPIARRVVGRRAAATAPLESGSHCPSRQAPTSPIRSLVTHRRYCRAGAAGQRGGRGRRTFAIRSTESADKPGWRTAPNFDREGPLHLRWPECGWGGESYSTADSSARTTGGRAAVPSARSEFGPHREPARRRRQRIRR